MIHLVEFLLARIAEREDAARLAGGTEWHWDHGFGQMCNDPDCPFGSLVADTKPYPTQLMDVHGYDIHEDWRGAAHIALNDPARVLAECAAKRKIIEDAAGENCYLGILRIMASVYEDHPDFQKDWVSTPKTYRCEHRYLTVATFAHPQRKICVHCAHVINNETTPEPATAIVTRTYYDGRQAAKLIGVEVPSELCALLEKPVCDTPTESNDTGVVQ